MASADHMVQGATEVGELRANADLLGHIPELTMNTYADTPPDSRSAVVERLRRQYPTAAPITVFVMRGRGRGSRSAIVA